MQTALFYWPKLPYNTQDMKKIKRLLIVNLILVILIGLAGAANYVHTKYTTIHPVSGLKVETDGLTQNISWEIEVDRWYYEVYQAEGNGDFRLVETVASGETPSVVFDKLSYGTVYRYKVVAVTSFLHREYKSGEVVVKDHTPTEGVKTVTAEAQGTDTIYVSWDKASNIAAYELRYSKNKDFKDAQTVELKVPSYTLTELEDDTEYFFSVRTYTQYDDKDFTDKYYSDWSQNVSAKTDKKMINVRENGADYSLPMIALTFDDGPDYSGYTERILNTLYRYGCYATFFQLGARSDDLGYLFRRMVDEGHEVGCHTYDHSHMGDSVTWNDIVPANDAIENACGIRPSAFRSPGGYTTSEIRRICEQEGQAIYYWTIDTRDWESRDAASVIDIVKNNVRDGSIILMHNIYGSTADAVDVLVPWLVENGYQLVTVSELIYGKTGSPPAAGVQYYSAYSWD